MQITRYASSRQVSFLSLSLSLALPDFACFARGREWGEITQNARYHACLPRPNVSSLPFYVEVRESQFLENVQHLTVS